MAMKASETTKAGSVSRLEREAREIAGGGGGGQVSAIAARLPAASLAQRVSAMSLADLMMAARRLAVSTDSGADAACTAVLEELERRVPGAAFDAFVAGIYA